MSRINFAMWKSRKMRIWGGSNMCKGPEVGKTMKCWRHCDRSSEKDRVVLDKIGETDGNTPQMIGEYKSRRS